MEQAPWGVILAGGDGARLKALSRFISGDDRPKQFCALFGGKTLLARTRARIASEIPAERTLFVVVQAHELFYRTELAGIDESQIVVQPGNKGTTAAIIYSLVRLTLFERDPMVAVFPVDHDYEDENAFAEALQEAIRAAREHPDLLVVLGAEADDAEVQYGWIEPGELLKGEGAGISLFRVNRFWEKPASGIARDLHSKGCLWNTFVLVGRARTFLDVLMSAVPAVCNAFMPLRSEPLSSASELERAARVYETLPKGDFSHEVLAACTGRLAVLSLGRIGWSDLGTPERVRLAAEARAHAWQRDARREPTRSA
jgi:mannose-1-phosphate guanylyltransferase